MVPRQMREQCWLPARNEQIYGIWGHLMLILVRTVRTDRFTGETYEAKGELSIHRDEQGIHVFMTKGGETGFESFTIHPSRKVHVHEWCACVGRRGEYDTVIVPEEEMERTYREAGIVD